MREIFMCVTGKSPLPRQETYRFEEPLPPLFSFQPLQAFFSLQPLQAFF